MSKQGDIAQVREDLRAAKEEAAREGSGNLYATTTERGEELEQEIRDLESEEARLVAEYREQVGPAPSAGVNL